MENYLIFCFTRNIVELRRNLEDAEKRAAELSNAFQYSVFNICEMSTLVCQYTNGRKI